MDQKTMVHVHNGILRSREKEGAPTLWDSMDGTGEHCAKWNKPGGERQIAYKSFEVRHWGNRMANSNIKWNIVALTVLSSNYL